MNIGEKATTLACGHDRETVLAQAAAVLQGILLEDLDALIGGREVAWLVAAAMVKTVVNGAPRVVTRVLSDHVQTDDRVG